MGALPSLVNHMDKKKAKLYGYDKKKIEVMREKLLHLRPFKNQSHEEVKRKNRVDEVIEKLDILLIEYEHELSIKEIQKCGACGECLCHDDINNGCDHLEEEECDECGNASDECDCCSGCACYDCRCEEDELCSDCGDTVLDCACEEEEEEEDCLCCNDTFLYN